MHRIHLTIPPHTPSSKARPSPRTRTIQRLFNLRAATPHPPLWPPLHLSLAPAEILLISGPSGTGKSTLLRQIAHRLRRHPTPIAFLRLSDIPLPTRCPLLDTFPLPLPQTLSLLTRAGLAEPALWLRPPTRLSEGQQFRFRLAHWMASSAPILLADAFAESLDPLTAKILAWQLARFIRQSPRTTTPRAAILATTRTDLLPDLHPTIHLQLPLAPDPLPPRPAPRPR